MPPRAGLSCFEEELGTAENDGQKVIEVVRDSSRQQPHNFHLLRLTELLLQVPSFGNVFHNDFEMAEQAILTGDRPCTQANSDDLAVFTFPIDFNTVHAPAEIEAVPANNRLQ